MLSNPGIDETILRVVGGLWITSDQTGAAEEQVGACGMIVVSDRAITTGITAIPDPVTEIGDDGWFLYVPFAQSSARALTGLMGYWYPFDSKAKRIITDGFSVAVVIANASSVHVLQFALSFRFLTQVRGT